MKTKIFGPVAAMLLCGTLSFLCACARMAEPLSLETTGDEPDRISIRLSFPAREEASTRSGWNGSPDRVESFVLMAYRDGRLDTYVRANAGEAASIRLFRGQTYQLYALANVSDFVPPSVETEMETLALPVDDFQQASVLPMACRLNNFVPQLSGQTLVLAFERLFARLTLHLDKGEWGMLRVGSVRLRQVAAQVHPFADSDAGRVGSSMASAGTDALYRDGDVASESDLLRLNAGDSLVLYVPQNRQGSLLPGNTEPERRVPESLGEKADQCTYLELTASPDGETLLAGEALCRIYLGRNAADNFDIPGNANLDLSVFLTERMMGGWGWRIESRLSWQAGAVTGWLAEGMHSLDDLYVGEVFRYAVQPSDVFLATVGGDFSRCSLCFDADTEDASLPAESDTTLLISAWTPTETGVWYVDVHCRKPVEAGRICLCLEGDELFDLSDGLTVRLPDYAFPHPPDVPINAESPTRCPLDICDRQGRSLTAAYGFDAGLFTPHYSFALASDAGMQAEDNPPLSVFSQWTADPPSVSAPFGACALSVFHTGDTPEVARFLTESLQDDSVFRLQVQDDRYPMEAGCFVRTDLLPIDVSLIDGGSPESSWRLCVNNPSLLPLDWGLVFLPSGWVENPYVEPPAICRTLRVICGVSDLFLVKRVKVLSEQVRDTLILPVSVATLRTHCQACACHFDAIRWVGVEPGLRYGDCRDKRLDEKIELSCALSVEEPDCGLFASSAESWSGDQVHPEPLWLRYSAYDDIGDLQITLGIQTQDLIPTIAFRTDKEGDEHRFKLSYDGDINGFVRIERTGPYAGPNISYDIFKSFYSASSWLPADGQSYLCSDGNFAEQCQDILQMGSEFFDFHTHYYPLIKEFKYAVSVTYDPIDRIYSPEYAGSLHFVYYDNKVGHDWNVGASMASGAERKLYLFE